MITVHSAQHFISIMQSLATAESHSLHFVKNKTFKLMFYSKGYKLRRYNAHAIRVNPQTVGSSCNNIIRV
jgi:hypothetical protein